MSNDNKPPGADATVWKPLVQVGVNKPTIKELKLYPCMPLELFWLVILLVVLYCAGQLIVGVLGVTPFGRLAPLIAITPVLILSELVVPHPDSLIAN